MKKGYGKDQKTVKQTPQKELNKGDKKKFITI